MTAQKTTTVVTICILIAAIFLSAVPMPFADSAVVHAQDIGTEATQTTQQGSGGQTQGPACDSVWSFFANPITCLLRSVGVLIGTMLMSAAGWLMSIAGLLFNYLIDVTVVQFGQFYTDGVAESVERVWSAFRDVANIAIIGGFVFVAISMILGINEFGSKKFVANLIIVAVLINFSLFFTKVVVDASNITASQFDRAIDAQRPQSAETSATDELFNPSGVAGAFFDYMNVTSFADTYSILNQVGQENSTGVLSNGGLTAFIYGLMGATIFLTVAATLLYGSFLLAARAVILIILLATSALAFASFAVPKLDTWWKRWIDELIRNAFFAPLLMLLLWATLIVSESLSQRSSGSLSGIVSDPTNILSLSALFNFAIILGLLFISIHASRHMSTAGAKILPDWKKAFGLGLFGAAGAVSLGGAMLGRQTIGRALRNRQSAMMERARLMGEEAEKTGNKGQARRANLVAGMARRLDAFTKSDMNLANTGAAKALTGMAGLKGRLAGQTQVGGIEGSDKTRAKRYAENAQRMEATMSDEDKQAMKDTAIAAAKQGQAGRQGIEDAERTRADKVKRLEREKDRKAKQYESELRVLEQQVSSGQKSQGELDTIRRERESELRREDSKIRQARSELAEATQGLQKLNKEAEKAGEASPAEQFAGGAAHARFSNILGRKMGIGDTPDKDSLAKAARKAVAGQKKDKRIKDTFTAAGIEDIVKKSVPKPDDPSGGN